MVIKVVKLLSAVVVLAFVLGVANSTHAQERGDAPNVEYKKKTIYDFDDDLVEGELQRPDGELIDASKRAKHSSLIQIRENFIPEMLKSAEDI